MTPVNLIQSYNDIAAPHARIVNNINRLIASGKIKRQPCSKCGVAKADAHHEDYSKPMEIVWLCRKCHKARHAEINKSGVGLPPFKLIDKAYSQKFLHTYNQLSEETKASINLAFRKHLWWGDKKRMNKLTGLTFITPAEREYIDIVFFKGSPVKYIKSTAQIKIIL